MSMTRDILQLRSQQLFSNSQHEQIEQFQDFCRQMKQVGLLKGPQFDLAMIGETPKGPSQPVAISARSDSQQFAY